MKTPTKLEQSQHYQVIQDENSFTEQRGADAGGEWGGGFPLTSRLRDLGERRWHRPGHNRFFSIFGPPKALAEGKWTFCIS